jgi:membrane carboxypeptidase/penicillin-binding protein PbpC
LRPEHAYLISDILADNQARISGFGPNSPLQLTRPAAVKTGTTNDFRDNLAIGYTPDIVAGVWIGNADNTPMVEVGGASGAAPIWHRFMEQAHAELPVHTFSRPAGIVEIEVCADSGTLPSTVCPQRRTEIFAKDQPPLGPEYDMHQLVELDRPSGLLVNEYCRGNIERRYYQVFPPDGRAWATERGIGQPPTEYCPSVHLLARLTAPVAGRAVRGIIPVEGSALAPKFAYFQLELGTGTNPQSFVVIQNAITDTIRKKLLGTFDTRQLENGPYTLRLVVFDQLGGSTDDRALILVDNPPGAVAASTPVTTPPFTPTPLLTATLTITGSVVFTAPLPATGTPPPPVPPPSLQPDLAVRVFTEPVTIPPQPLPAEPSP